MQNEDKTQAPHQAPEELPFKSIFDPRGQPPPDIELWITTPKDFDVAKLGPVIYTSKLRKKSKQIGIYIVRFYFLFKNHLGYSNSSNPSKIKKYLELDGLKVRFSTQTSKNKGAPKFHLTLYRLKMSIELVTKHKSVADEWKRFLGGKCIMLDFPQFYVTKEILGKGAHGKVLLAESVDETKKYAVKVFEKVKILTQFRGWQNLANEIQILRGINHKDIIKLHEVYESENEIHLVLEYVSGGDLQTRIRRKGNFSEKNSITLIKNLLEVLKHIHSKGIVHRDIKPGNIVLCNMESDTEIKLIDFGFAMEIEKCRDLNLRCGTPGYVAPEVLNPSLAYPITEKVDIFSVGTIFYQLLSGAKLFPGRSNHQVLNANKKCIIDVTKLVRKDVSKESLDLLLKMLDRNPDKRISAEEALGHNLFTHYMHYIASSAEILDDPQILPMPQTTKYSFDMGSLKERNISSHSRIIDTYGTFYVIPHISIDALDSLSNRGKPGGARKSTPTPSRKGSENSFRGHTVNRTRPMSPESWDDSMDEESKGGDKKSTSFEAAPKIARKLTTTGGQSPIHKVAIMNNVKKLNLVKEESVGNTEEDGSKQGVMPVYDLMGNSVKLHS